MLENKPTILTVGQIKTRHHLRTTKEKFTTSLVCVFFPQIHNLNPSGGNIQQLEGIMQISQSVIFTSVEVGNMKGRQKEVFQRERSSKLETEQGKHEMNLSCNLFS